MTSPSTRSVNGEDGLDGKGYETSCVPGSRAGLWIVESQIATPGLYCVIIALTRNLNY